MDLESGFQTCHRVRRSIGQHEYEAIRNNLERLLIDLSADKRSASFFHKLLLNYSAIAPILWIHSIFSICSIPFDSFNSFNST